MSDIEVWDENEPIFDPQATEAFKLAATFKAVSEACGQLHEPALVIPVADVHEPFSILLGRFRSPYGYLYTTDRSQAENKYLKSLGYTGQAAKLAQNLVHDKGYYVSDIYGAVSQNRDGLIVRKVNTEQHVFRAISVTISQPDRLRRAVEQRFSPYDRVSAEAAGKLLLWYGSFSAID